MNHSHRIKVILNISKTAPFIEVVHTNLAIKNPSANTSEQYPTCNCWTRECGFCSNLECTVKQDLLHSNHGIEVRSHIQWKKFNTIVLFDEDGRRLGNFEWSLSRLFLTGCVGCRTPRALRKASSAQYSSWAIVMNDGFFRIKMEGEILFERKLSRKCAEVYGRASRFAFSDMSCENTFSFIPNEMEIGEKIKRSCAGSCS